MSTLEVREVKYFEVEYSDMEEWMKELYPDAKEISLPAMVEINDATHTMVANTQQFSDYETEELRLWAGGEKFGWCGTPELVLRDQCIKGNIEPGNYMFYVSV